MDLGHDKASTSAEEDRISSLPNDIILRILSFLDIKYAIQTCMLSRKWKNIWTSVPHLNFNSDMFCSVSQFSKFVANVLSHRNSQTKVSAADLAVMGSPTQLILRDVINYTYLHNVMQLTLFWSSQSFYDILPPCIFSSHTLKHLTLHTSYSYYQKSNVPKSAWDFPTLETLSLTSISVGRDGDDALIDESLDLFSKCVNLKDLTLHRCCIHRVDVFNICCPQLLNLTITYASAFPKVFNIVAPQLQNLTAPVLPSIMYDSKPFNPLQLSTKGLGFLDKVNLTLAYPISGLKKDEGVLLNLFQTLRSAKYLILDVDLVKALGSDLNQLLHEPCPFKNLECLKIKNFPSSRMNYILTITPQVRNYFFENSTTATLIIDLPQGSFNFHPQVSHGLEARGVFNLH